MIAELRSSAAHLFVDDLSAPEPGRDDEHHLFRVLRLRDGERVTVGDGAGRWRATVVSGGALVPDGAVSTVVPAPDCTVATAVPKGDRPKCRAASESAEPPVRGRQAIAR